VQLSLGDNVYHGSGAEPLFMGSGSERSLLKLRAFCSLVAQPRGKICSFLICCKLSSRSKPKWNQRIFECLGLSLITCTLSIYCYYLLY